MANELGYMHFATGRTGVFRIRSLVDATQIWNNVTLAWETYLTANIAQYGITSVEQGTASRWHIGTFPPTIEANNYLVQFWDVASDNPATVTEADLLVGDYLVAWNGSSVVTGPDLIPVDYTFSPISQVDITQCGILYRGSGVPLRFTPTTEMVVNEDYWEARLGKTDDDPDMILFSVALGNMIVVEATGVTTIYPTPTQTEGLNPEYPPRLEFWRTGPGTANVALVAIVNITVMDTLNPV